MAQNQIDALVKKVQQNSEKFVAGQPLLFKFNKEVDPWL